MKVHGRKTYKAGPRDECGSPIYAIIPILMAIDDYRMSLDVSRKEFAIWEPAIGLTDEPHTGIVDGLLRLGYSAIGTTEDFLDANIHEVEERLGHGLRIRMILTNPPFSVALKRRFIYKCNELLSTHGIPWGLLMMGLTHQEKLIRAEMRRTALHIPLGRINFDMPNKGWGTPENPTKATFSTAWYTKGLCEPDTVHYNDFDMSDHFDAMRRFDRVLASPYWRGW